MRPFITYFTLATFCLTPGPGSVITISGQGQQMDIKLLNRGDDQQCASIEEREKARNEIHQIANSAAILAATGHIHTCNGSYTRMEGCCFYQHD